jgi:hypothetical protein
MPGATNKIFDKSKKFSKKIFKRKHDVCPLHFFVRPIFLGGGIVKVNEAKESELLATYSYAQVDSV